MNKKIVYLSALVLIIAMGFLYANSERLTANNSSQKKNCCTDQTTSASNNKDIKSGGDQYSTYEFATDKACCQEMKTSLQKGLMGAAGVKDVKFSETCSASKMTMVTVTFAPGETNQDKLATFVKDNKFDCPVSPNCDKEGCSKNKSSGGKTDGTCPHNGCDMKSKKTSGKEI